MSSDDILNQFFDTVYAEEDADFMKKKEVTLQDIKDVLLKTGHRIEWDPDKIMSSIYHDSKNADTEYHKMVATEDQFFFFITCGLHDVPWPENIEELTPELFFMYKGRAFKVVDCPFTVDDMWDTVKKADGMKSTRRLCKFPLLYRQAEKLQTLLNYRELSKEIDKVAKIKSENAVNEFEKVRHTDKFKNIKATLFGKRNEERDR